ncbi:alpha/beta fold hydrolase [Stenotrophomonas sp. BIGb0135]|uniref:alpha/beta hydrolase family protein n=1 Tax=Stenotrophomonas sp. BIGb0135 TaxID=2940620 RepID=UPI002166EA57|nr:alpha/beta fold hydrolase [Stenotrophomonas sp. BIGb0135]MCS4234309.1 putative alpha/beta hydrolase [Stenotrophomonas sp. BIGb0135]
MIDALAVPITAADGHRFELLARVPAQPRAHLLWLPALGVAARHYLPLADALAAHGVAVYLHEWRGNGSSSLRPSRTQDWGYRELLTLDLPASLAQLAAGAPTQGVIGGHSLGGQLACCFAGQHPGVFQRLWLVASGTPYWRTFPAPRGWTLPLIYRFLPWLAHRQGVLPGRRLGFGGTEARGLITDWAKVGLNNRYAGAGIGEDLEAGLRGVCARATAVVMEQDWLAPATSMHGLLAKMPQTTATLSVVSPAALGVRADHFAWMTAPQAVAALLFHSLE